MSARRERTETPGVYRRGSRWVARVPLGDGRKAERAFRTYAEARTFRLTTTSRGRPPTELELPTNISRVRLPAERAEAVGRLAAFVARLLADPSALERLAPAFVARGDAWRRAGELLLREQERFAPLTPQEGEARLRELRRANLPHHAGPPRRAP